MKRLEGPTSNLLPLILGAALLLTACQQTCPSDAITFGNVRDQDSQAVKLAKEAGDRAYHALQILNTRSAVTYLAQVRRDENGGH